MSTPSHRYKIKSQGMKEFQLEINKNSDIIILTLPTSDLKKLSYLFKNYERWIDEHTKQA